MYGLESFDSQIKALYDDIAEIEDEKQSALEDFEKNTKADIISEINERYADKICNMETELEKKKWSMMNLMIWLRSREYTYHLIMKRILVKNLLM